MSSPSASWRIRDGAGNIVAIHERHDEPSGKRLIWRQPDGSIGLNGRSITELPLYGSERLPAGELVVLCEGEKAADAAFSAGYASAGTVTGAASAPGLAPLSVLIGHPVVLWPDADAVGMAHMERIGLRLTELGVPDLRMVAPNGWAPGTDAADLSTDEIMAAVLGSTAWRPVAGALAAEDPEGRPYPEPPAAAAYAGLAGELVAAVAPHTEADPVALLGTVLVTTGMLCAGPILYQGSQQAANVFVALVGETSHGRKGTSLATIGSILSEAYPRWVDFVVPGLGSGEGLVGHLKRREEDDPRALIRETEMGRMLVAMNRDGSVLSPILRDAWDRSPMGRVLAREEQIVYRHHVGLLGHITLPELRAKLTSLDSVNGFGNRILWLATRRPHLVPFSPDPRGYVSQDLLIRWRRVIDEGERVREVRWEIDAAMAWDQLYRQMAEDHPAGLLGAMTARAEPQIVRLALLYAIFDMADEISEAHLASAVALWEYSMRCARYIWGESTGNPDADALWRLLRRSGGEGYSLTELRNELGLRRASDLDAVVALLVDAGIAKRDRVKTSGRPRILVTLRQEAVGGR